MPKYLIRGGRLPYQKVPVEKYLDTNVFGNNSGNYMYLNSIIRTLTTDSTVEFECTNYKQHYSDKEIDRINNECDGFIIPLADAFRPDFKKQMKSLTSIVNKLSIPSYIIGVGIRADSESQILDMDFDFIDEAKDFVKAVLRKSACIGVRGELTGKFLEQSGFKEGEDYRMIGCPSLYTYGNHLRIRDTIINKNCKASCSGTLTTDMETIQKMSEFMNEFHDLTFVGQLRQELKTLYLGTDYKTNPEYIDLYPCNIDHPLYAKDKVRFFYNTHEWVNFYKNIDFTFGTRFHGVVSSVLAGTPSVLFTKDMRMRELAEFHNLTHLKTDQLNTYKNIWEIIDSVDFHSPESVAQKNFENYLDFLHLNGLKTIYDDDINREDAPLDQILAEADITPDVTSCVSCSSEELAGRLKTQYEFVSKLYEKSKAKTNNSAKTAADDPNTVRQLKEQVGIACFKRKCRVRCEKVTASE
ncbi:MAG: polysaccharide pyruvyl transferase family protein [Clostridiales bacterium]|nr:polysaccharide pyruvyl transferase family protein [Clostridiales bacterium]